MNFKNMKKLKKAKLGGTLVSFNFCLSSLFQRKMQN